jgi:iron complex outermembrane recepter protein
MSKINQLSNAIKFALFVGASASLVSFSSFAQEEKKEEVKEVTGVTVTGSRIKRVDAEGASPVNVITREEIERSGEVSVADVLRNTTFSSSGNFRPQSGSSAQALADIDLRGIGSNRTLVLIDGRRAPKAPFSGQSTDVNAVPLAAVERIEILSDGASAVYGSDAIGGVVNIILRKDFNGAEFKLGTSFSNLEGGDTETASAVFGISGDRGSMLAGASYSDRGIIFTRDRPWGATPGASTFSNTWQLPNAAGLGVGPRNNFPGFACNTNGFYLSGTTCVYDFNLQAADEAAINNKSLFARGEYEINENWLAYMNASVSRVESFGRYAPAPVQFTIRDGTPNDQNPAVDNPATPFVDEGGTVARHRFAAGGNRDTNTDANVYDFLAGFKGRIGEVDLDAGVRRNEYKFYEIGNGFVVRPLFEAAVNSGAYNLFNPFANSQAVINSVKTTTARNSTWKTEELFATASFGLFEMSGGSASGVFGAEYRTEDYADIYDSLSSAGVVEGSSGNSAGGGRSVRSAYFEVLLPIVSTFEVNVAGRFDKYSDYGSDFAPKVSMRWKPIESFALRGSYGEGFAAPSLDILTQQPAFSADSVTDLQTCVSFGFTAAQCLNPVTGVEREIQIDGTVVANSSLGSEQSKQFAIGAVWDATDWLTMTLDYTSIKIEDRIVQFSAQTLIDRNLNPALGAIPPGLSVTRDPVTGAILNVTRGSANEGDLKSENIDFVARTKFDFSGYGVLENQLQVSHVRKYTIDDGQNLSGTSGLPRFRATLQNVWTKGDFSLGWNVNHIGKQDRIGAGNYSVVTHDVQGAWNTPWKGRLAVGVSNIEGQLPQLRSFQGRPFNFSLYDAYGRQVYLNYTQTF